MISFLEVHNEAIEHPHPNTLPEGGEPEAIYNYMVEMVESAEMDSKLAEDELEKLEDEHDDEIKKLEKDYETLHTEHEKLLKSVEDDDGLADKQRQVIKYALLSLISMGLMESASDRLDSSGTKETINELIKTFPFLKEEI